MSPRQDGSSIPAASSGAFRTFFVNSKENEITAAPRIIKSIDLRGKIVTGDAMFTQRELSKEIVEAGGDYLWSVKDNQQALREEIEAVFSIEEGKTNLKAMPTGLAKKVY